MGGTSYYSRVTRGRRGRDEVLQPDCNPQSFVLLRRREKRSVLYYSLVPQSLNLNAMGMSMYLLFALFMSRRNSGMQVAQHPQYSINQKVVCFFFFKKKKSESRTFEWVHHVCFHVFEEVHHVCFYGSSL